MDREKLNKKFIEFLAKNGVLFEYSSKISIAPNKAMGIVEGTSMQMVMQTLPPDDYINAIMWTCTAQGGAFWYHLNIRWEDICYE